MKNIYSLSLIFLFLSVLQRNEGIAQVNISNGSTTVCLDSLYDSGGPTGSYSASETLEYTISPTNAISVTITIDSIDIASGDILRIYDGTSSADPLLYEFNDTSIFIPGPITTSAGDVTIRFTSNATTEDFGFKLHWLGNLPAASVLISKSVTNNICVGDNVTFTATPTNGGASPNYQWYKNGSTVGTNSNTYADNGLVDNDYVWVELEADVSGCIADTAYDSLQVTVTSYTTASVSLASSVTNNVCVGDNVTFTATPTNGGTSPTYSWFLNGGAVGSNSPTYMNSTLIDDDTVRVVMASDFASGCLTDSMSFDSLKMNVTAYTTASVSLTSTKTDLCTGDNITFTASPTNGGSSPTYSWFLNGGSVGSNSPTYMNSTLNDDDTVRVVMASDFDSGCLTDSISFDSIKVNVTTITTASVSLAKSVTNVCAGNNVTFTATPTNGGSSPTYSWFLNGGAVGSNSPTYMNSTLIDDDTVRVVMASDFNGGCLVDSISFDSLKINVTTNTTASVSVTVSDPSVCDGTNVVFTATPTNGGTPAYKWTVNAGGTVSTSNTFSSSTLNDGDDVQCEMTSSIATGCLIDSVSTDNIVMNINNNPSASVGSPVIVNCYGDSTGGATASGSGGVSPYTYLWSNGETTAAATMLWAGSQRVYVTDDSLCLDSADIVITQNSEIIFSFTVTDASAYGSSDGSISVTMSGGVPSYDHEWSTGLPANNKVTTVLSGLAAGTYADTVLDHSGVGNTCKVWASTTVNQPGILLGGSIRIGGSTSKQICAGTNVGLMTNQTPATGGIGTLNYRWQYSYNLLSWTNYPTSNSTTYTLNDSISAITFVRRIVVDGVNDTVSSNILFLNYIADQFINIIGLEPVYCQGDPIDLIIGTPNSPGTGAFSGGAHITGGGNFNPSLAASSPTGSTNDIIYTYTDSYSCVSSKKLTTLVYDTTTGSVSIIKTLFSASDSAATLVETGYPGGGTFTGTGVKYSIPKSAYIFDPADVDSSLFDIPLLISYEYSAPNGCVSRHYITVTVQDDQVTLRTSSNVAYFSSCGNKTSDRIVADLPTGVTVDYYYFYIYNSTYTAVIWNGLTYSGLFTDSIIYPFNPSQFNPVATTSPYNPGPTPVGVNNYHVRFYYQVQGTSVVLLEKDIELVNLGSLNVTSSYVNDNGTAPNSYFLYCENKDSSELSTTYLNLGARSVSHTIEAVSAAPGLVNDHGDGTAAVYPENAALFYDYYRKSFQSDQIRYTYEDDLSGCKVSAIKTLYTPRTPPVAITTDKGNHTKDSVITTLVPDYGGYSIYYLPANYLNDSSKVIKTYKNGNLYSGTNMAVYIGDTITWDTLYITPIQSAFCSHDGYLSFKGLPWWSNRGTFSSSNNSALDFVSSSTADTASITITDNAVGNQWFQYKIKDLYGCTDSIRAPFIVDPVPVLDIYSLSGYEFCEDADSVKLVGRVWNGSFSPGQGDSITGPGIYYRDALGGAYFFADSAGPGNHTIRFHYTDAFGTGCYNYIDTIIVVNPLPDPSFSASDTAMCNTAADWASFSYDGIQPGTSLYYLVGFAGAITTFDPVDNPNITFGPNKVRNVFTHSTTGCKNRDTITIMVDSFPNVAIDLGPGNFCYNAGNFTYIGSPASPGGVMSSYFNSASLGIFDIKTGAGQDSGSYNPSPMDIGSHYITYNYTDPITGCFNKDSAILTIYDIPTLSLRILNDPFAPSLQHCLGDSVEYEKVKNGTPDLSLNSYLVGPGFADSTDIWFNPDSAGTGSHMITYKSVDGNGCFNEIDTIITVIPTSNPSFTMSSNVACLDPDGFIVLTPNATPSNFGGTFKFPDIFDEVVNVSTDTFYIDNAFWGGDTTYTVRYVYDVGFGCVDSMDQVITVNDTPHVAFTVIDPEYCNNQGTVGIHVDAPSLGSSYFRSYLYPGYQDFNDFIDSNLLANGVDSIQFTPVPLYTGNTMYVDYVHVDANGCEGIAWDNFVIKNIPVLNITFMDLIPGLPGANDVNFCALSDSEKVIGAPTANMQLPINNGWYTGSVFGQSNNLVTNNGDGTGTYGPYPLNTLSLSATDTITYHYQDSNAYGCYNSKNIIVNIKPQPITDFVILPSDNPNSTNICPDEKSLMSSEYDSIALYKVLWPTANVTRKWIINDTLNAYTAKQFNPGPPGVKDTSRYNAWNSIRHTMLDKRYGCYSEYADSTYLDSFPIVDLTFDSTLYCTNSGTIVFTGSPASPGATLPSSFTSSDINNRFVSGSVVLTQTGKDTIQINMNGITKPGVNAISIKNISYTYTEPATECRATKSKTFKLKRAPVLGLNVVNKLFCPYNNDVVVSLVVNSSPSTLQGRDTITGLGLVYPINSGGQINYNPRTFLGSLTTITDTITYTHVDSNYCTSTLIDANFVVKHQPKLDLIIPQFKDSVCLEDNPFALDIRYWSLDSSAYKSYPPLSGTSPGSGVDQNYFLFDNISPSTGPTSKSFWPLFDSKNKTDGVVTEVKFVGSYENNGCYDTLKSVIVTHPKPVANFYLDGYCGKYLPSLHGDSSYIDALNFSPSDGIVKYEWTVNGDDSAWTQKNRPISQGGMPYNDTLVDYIHHWPMGLNKVNIDLIAVSKKGCVSNKLTKSIQFLTSPNADFTWNMGDECFGDNVAFIGGGDVPDTITTDYFWDFGDGFTSTDKLNTNHVFASVDTFSVSLILTEGGSACQDTATKNIFIRPIISNFPHVDDFETAYSGWVPWKKSGDKYWVDTTVVPNVAYDGNFEHGVPNKKYINSAASGSNVWATGLNLWYANDLETSVTSPCYDLSSLERPMLKIKTLYNSKEDDGAVIQYTTDTDKPLDKVEWKNVGNYFEDGLKIHRETGINWYNKKNIFGAPGNQSNLEGKIGWTLDLDSSARDGIWKESRHNMDSLIGEPYVRFRVAFGSDPSQSLEGFAFDDFEVTERKRKVLFEGFVNSSSGSSDQTTVEAYDRIVKKCSLDVVDVQYHTVFPAKDPMNEQNTTDPSTRSLYYSVGEVPYVQVNGSQFEGVMNSTNFGEFTHQPISLLDPLFKIDMLYDVPTKQVVVNVTAVGPGTSYPLDISVHVALIERQILATEFTSNVGQYFDFKNVLKKMYPSAAGTILTAGFGGWSTTVTQTMNFDNFFTDSLYRIVAFVQDRNTKEVYQADWVGNGLDLGTEIPKYEDIVVNGVEYNLYPNPTDGTAFLEFRENLENSYEMRIYNQLGAQVQIDVIPSGTRIHQLDMGQLDAGMYFIMLNDGEHKVAIKKLMVTR